MLFQCRKPLSGHERSELREQGRDEVQKTSKEMALQATLNRTQTRPKSLLSKLIGRDQETSESIIPPSG